MANILRSKVILLSLVLSCTLCMIIYLGNVSQLDETGGSVEPSAYRQFLVNTSGKILPTPIVYLDRQEHLQKMCQIYGTKSPTLLPLTPDDESQKEMFDHVLVDENHRLLYCYVPKVACTNWKRIFMILTGRVNGTDILSIPASAAHKKGVFKRLSNYSSTEINLFLQTYTKFLFVRHPLERLLSAYRNKLEQHNSSLNGFQVWFGRHIVKHYRLNPSEESLERGDVTFAEFAAFLTSTVRRPSEFNEHWRPIHELCHPCIINYDIIGKYETLYEDSEFVLRQAVESKIEFPSAPKPSSTLSNLKKYFNTLSKETILQLHSIYATDFKLFGYDLEEYLGIGI